jgi:hypothetical protein
VAAFLTPHAAFVLLRGRPDRSHSDRSHSFIDRGPLGEGKTGRFVYWTQTSVVTGNFRRVDPFELPAT